MRHQAIIEHIRQRVKLTEVEAAAVQARLKERSYLKGQYVVQSGDICRNQTFVLEGKLRTFYLDDEGNEHIVAFGFENWWVGDICSFSTQTVAEFNTECIDFTRVVQLSYEDMEELYEEVPILERYFRLIIQRAYGNMSKRIIHNHSMSAKQRYLLFLDSYPEVARKVPQYMIASYLGITKEFLSSLRKQIASESKS